MLIKLLIDKPGIANAGQKVNIEESTAQEWIAAGEACEVSSCQGNDPEPEPKAPEKAKKA